MKKLFFIASFFMLLGMTACSSKDRDVLAVEQLTHRLIPQYADRFVFEIVPDEDRDYYSLESKDGKIHISGNNANSMAAGLNYYLKYYCLTTVSWYADIPVEMPDVLPMVEKPVVVEAKVDNRFFLNYCTYGYSMPFWKWKDWERFIDKMKKTAEYGLKAYGFGTVSYRQKCAEQQTENTQQNRHGKPAVFH